MGEVVVVVSVNALLLGSLVVIMGRLIKSTAVTSSLVFVWQAAVSRICHPVASICCRCKSINDVMKWFPSLSSLPAAPSTPMTVTRQFRWIQSGGGAAKRLPAPATAVAQSRRVTWCRWWHTGRSRRVWWWWSARTRPRAGPPAAAAAPPSETCGNGPSARGWCSSRGSTAGGNLWG